MFRSTISFVCLIASVSSTSILFPLYIYPETSTTWEPLYDAISSYSSVPFTIVVNPSSGPTSSPDSSYLPALEQLATYSSVQTIGYIDTAYGSKSVSDLEAEIDEYASWTAEVRPTGIFFDDITQSDEDGSWETVQTASAYAQVHGLSTIVLNPGTIPADDKLYSYATQTIISEIPYSSYASVSSSIAAIDVDPAELAVIFYSVPSDADLASSVSTFVERGYGSVFFTNLDGYTAFASDLDTFASDMAAAA